MGNKDFKKNVDILFVWLKKLLTKLVVVIGLLPFIFDIFYTYFLEDNTPLLISQLHRIVASFPNNLIILLISLLISSFLVFRGSNSSEVTEIKAGFNFKEKTYFKQLSIKLSPSPDENEVNKLIDKELLELRKEFEAENLNPAGLKKNLLGLSKRNENFNEEIEEYINKYKAFLKEYYEALMGKGFLITPILKNIGDIPATKITVEIIMPENYSLPKPHQIYMDSDEREIFLENLENSLPRKPKKFHDQFMTYIPSYTSLIDKINYGNEIIENPTKTKIDNKWKFAYEIDSLVPKKESINLEPISIWAGYITSNETWEITIRIFAAELSRPIISKFQVHFIIT